MSRKFQIGAALLIAASIVVMTIIGIAYRRDRDAYKGIYTRIVKQRDICDTARNAIAALQDSELQAQSFVLTGETVYSEAYASDVRVWQDEMGTVELMARHDPAAPIVQDLRINGTKVLDELTALVALRNGTSRDGALERIAKGSGIVYLEQARQVVAKIEELDGDGANSGNQLLIKTAVGKHLRLAEGAGILFCLAVAGVLLAFLDERVRITTRVEDFKRLAASDLQSAN